ncbi:Conserved exported protein of uncharacterised function [Mycobacterium tuberculosis]|nr:Conserved exported protein of uncharacterised function [Mycobacterium tuberculosis]
MKCPGVSDCVATVRHDNVFAIAAGLRWSAAVPPLHKGDAVTKLLVGAIAGGMLACAAILGDGIASADTALIVPGTAPSPYGPLRSLYHFNPAMQPQIGANYYNPTATRHVVSYPGSFWPVTGLNSPTVGSSVSAGTNNLDAAIRSTDGPIFVAGLSQGTLVLDREQARLANDPTAPPPGQLTFIKAGDPNNLLWRAFRPGTHVPIIDYTVPAPAESQYDTINIVGQYDIFLTRLIVRATYSLTSMRLPRADTTATAPPHSRTQLALRLGTLRRQRTVWVRRPRPTSSGPISYLWCGRWWTWRACPRRRREQLMPHCGP